MCLNRITTIYWTMDATDDYFWKVIPSVYSTVYFNKNNFKYIIYTMKPLTDFQKKVLSIIYQLTDVSIVVKELPSFFKKLGLGASKCKPIVWTRFYHPFVTKETCFYMDMDVICQKPIEVADNLLNNSEYEVLASEDPIHPYPQSIPAFKSAFNIDMTKYFCAGLSLFKSNCINQEKWDYLFKLQKLAPIYWNHPVLRYSLWYNDQDALNIVFHNKIGELPKNVADFSWFNDKKVKDSQLVHCTYKPWKFRSDYEKIWFDWQKPIKEYM